MPSKANILVVGSSGTGKTTTMRDFPPAQTAFINIEGKGLPFVDPKFAVYSEPQQWGEITAQIRAAKNNKVLKYIIVDSLTKASELLLAMSRTINKGYDIYTYHNIQMRAFLDLFRNSPDQYMILTGISEVVNLDSDSELGEKQRRCWITGKELEGKIEKEFTFVFFTTVSKGPSGKIEYKLRTNTSGACSSKSPMGLFDTDKEHTIPNNLWEAMKKIEGKGL